MQKSAWIAQVGEYMVWQSSALIAITENTAWDEKHVSTELFLTLKWNWPLVEEEEKKKSLWEQTPSMWFPDSSPGLWKNKEAPEFFFFFLFVCSWKSIPVQCATQQPDSSCLCRRDILEKVLEQFLHWYFFTSEWVCRWALRLDLSAKALLQWGQENGFSPVKRNEKEDTVRDRNRHIWIEMELQRHLGLLFLAGCNKRKALCWADNVAGSL